jgi:hypothetical protein
VPTRFILAPQNSSTIIECSQLQMGSPVRQELDDEDASAKNLIEEQLCHTQAQDARLTNLRIGPPERARAKFGDNSKTSKPPNS